MRVHRRMGGTQTSRSSMCMPRHICASMRCRSACDEYGFSAATSALLAAQKNMNDVRGPTGGRGRSCRCSFCASCSSPFFLLLPAFFFSSSSCSVVEASGGASSSALRRWRFGVGREGMGTDGRLPRTARLLALLSRCIVSRSPLRTHTTTKSKCPLPVCCRFHLEKPPFCSHNILRVIQDSAVFVCDLREIISLIVFFIQRPVMIGTLDTFLGRAGIQPIC